MMDQGPEKGGKRGIPAAADKTDCNYQDDAGDALLSGVDLLPQRMQGSSEPETPSFVSRTGASEGDGRELTSSLRTLFPTELPVAMHDIGSRTLSTAREAASYVVHHIKAASASPDIPADCEGRMPELEEERLSFAVLRRTSFQLPEGIRGFGSRAVSTASEAVDCFVETVRNVSTPVAERLMSSGLERTQIVAPCWLDEETEGSFEVPHHAENDQASCASAFVSARNAADLVMKTVRSAASSLAEMAAEQRITARFENEADLTAEPGRDGCNATEPGASEELQSARREAASESKVGFVDRILRALEEKRKEASGYLLRVYSDATESTVAPRETASCEFVDGRSAEQGDIYEPESLVPRMTSCDTLDILQGGASMGGDVSQSQEVESSNAYGCEVPDSPRRPEISTSDRNFDDADQGWLRELVEVLDNALRREGQVDTEGRGETRDIDEVLSHFSEEIQKRLSENGAAAKRCIENLGEAYRAGDVGRFRQEVANLMDVGGPEVSGAWATVKVGMGLATLITGHALAGTALVLWGTGAVGSAYLWSSNREAVHNWVAGTDEPSTMTMPWSHWNEAVDSPTSENVTPLLESDGDIQSGFSSPGCVCEGACAC